MAYHVVSVLLRKPISLMKAREWLLEHGYVYRKVHETAEFLRFRQQDPEPLERTGWRFRTSHLGEVGELVVAYPPRHVK